MIKPSILFVVTQPYASTISDEEIVQAIPSHLKGIHYQVIPIDINSGDLSKLGEVDFIDLRNRQYEQVIKDLKFKLLEKPNRHILYIGKAPIPLAIHLGAQVESFEKTDAAFQKHRTNEWYYETQPDSATVIETELPSGGSLAPGDVIIKIETSYSIADSEITKTVSQPLATYTIRSNNIHPDSMNGPLTKEFIVNFLEILAHIHKNFPNRTATHFFTSIPMGLAFEIGAALNPTIHYPVVTYQYFRGQEIPYRKAIVLGEESAVATKLNQSEKEILATTADIWKQELAVLQNLAVTVSTIKGENWIDRLFPNHDFGKKLDSNFREQKSIGETAIGDFKIADSFDDSGVEFTFEPKDKKWIIGEYLGYHFWLASLQERAKLGPLVRLFLLHEAVHSERQRLHSENSENIGRFPRVLEEIDYHADIWAICHELYYALKVQGLSVQPRKHAMDLIQIIIGSFMAFDRASGFRDGFQVRRLNRYLLWLWQFILLTEARTDISVEAVVDILLNKPVVDIAGPQIVCRGERVFITLNPEKLVAPEIAVYFGGSFSRHEGNAAVKIFEGLKEFNTDKMIQGLREIYHKVKK